MVIQRSVILALLTFAFAGNGIGQTLAHLWAFDGDLTDSSPNGNDGSAIGTPEFVAGKWGQAVSLDATPDGGTTPGDGVENTFSSGLPSLGTDDWSMNVWVNFAEAPTALEYLVGFGVSDDFLAGDEGRARGLLNFGTGYYFWGAANDVDSGVTYDADGEWHMYTVTYDATETTIAMYKDASLVTSSVLPVPLEDTFDQVQAGNPAFWNEDFNGLLDEFAIYSDTLSVDQIGGLFIFNDPTQSVTVDPSLTVDRDTGEIVLTNDSDFDIELLGYTVRSASGALDPSAWDTIAGRFDAPPGGDGSIDANDSWTVLTNTSEEFSIEFSEGVPGTDGGTIETGKVVNFGVDSWIKNPTEDLFIDLLLNDGEGSTQTVAATFTGNGDASYALGDFDTDGDIDTNDFAILRNATAADTSELLPVAAYLGGDLNGDGLKNLDDYAVFRVLFDSANGPGSFAAMVSAVPEPGSMVVLLPILAAAVLVRKRIAATAAVLAVACCWFGSDTANAQLHGYYKLNGDATEETGNNIDLNLVGGATFAGSVHPGLGTAFNGDGIDDAAIGENFVKVSGNDLSVVAWVFAETNDLTPWETIAKQWGELVAGQFHFGLGVADDNFLNNFYATAGGAAFPTDVSPADVPVGQWVHAAFVLDSVAGEHRLYIDGVAVTTGVYEGTLLQPEDAGFATGFGIGGKPNDDGTLASPGFGFWDGQIDEVGIYSAALSDADIAQIISDAEQGIQLDGTSLPYVEIQVDRATGEVMLQNNTAGPVDLSAYELASPNGNLDASNLDALAGDAGFPSGTGSGDGWEADGANGSTQIIEGFFSGSSTFAVGETSLGNVYDGLSVGSEDVEFRFATPTGIVNSFVTYINDYANLVGDFNGDGVVNTADYTVWRDNLGAPTEDAINNSGDGLNGVDVQDYLEWKANFGATGALIGQVTAAVPEPNSVGLLVLLTAVVGLMSIRGSKNR